MVDDDRSALSTALEAALGDNRDEDVEVRVRTPRSPFPTRCLVNIRMVDDQISAMNGALLCVSDVTDSARLREELERRATIDTLTGCRNRPSTLAFLEDVLASGAPAAVAFIDVNGFKAVNDGFGHAAGDDLLEDVGARLMTTARAGDVVGRLGGDEFLLICPGVADPSAAWAIASRAAEALQDLAPLGRTTLEPIASIGVAHCA